MYLFLDCEFNGWHDQGTGELISLGLVERGLGHFFIKLSYNCHLIENGFSVFS